MIDDMPGLHQLLLDYKQTTNNSNNNPHQDCIPTSHLLSCEVFFSGLNRSFSGNYIAAQTPHIAFSSIEWKTLIWIFTPASY